MTPPPEAVLIRLVRQAAGLTVDAASERAGISKARWTQVETGREKRKDGYHRAVAAPGTLARMAQAVRIPPSRLAGEGERPDAAEVLAEILRDQPAPATPGRPRFPDDPDLDDIAAKIWALGGEGQIVPAGKLRDIIEVIQLEREQHRASDPAARRAAG